MHDSLTVKINKLLANHLGVEPEDIENDDSLSEDLHMTAVELTDFVHVLEKEGYPLSEIDYTELDTVGDLIDSISSHEEIK